MARTGLDGYAVVEWHCLGTARIGRAVQPFLDAAAHAAGQIGSAMAAVGDAIGQLVIVVRPETTPFGRAVRAFARLFPAPPPERPVDRARRLRMQRWARARARRQHRRAKRVYGAGS
jgi:hypothetical protein